MHQNTHWRYRLISTVLTLAFMIHLLPAQVFAAAAASPAAAPAATDEPVRIVEEVTRNRTEFSKEFRLSNGLHIAAVYNEAVHYDNNGQWQEIDNTLVAAASRGTAVYRNTAGVWEVNLPQALTKDSPITITKDGGALSFRMAGQLIRLGSASGAISREQGYSLSPVQQTQGQIRYADRRSALAQAEYPETVNTLSRSRLEYSQAFANTDIIYDLQGNRLKESIVMESFSANLGGYRYTLNTEGLVPVLQEDNRIFLYGSGKAEIVMVMPAPFLIDAAGEICYDVGVTLTPNGGSYTLDYILPQDWLASRDRQWPVVLDPVIQADLETNNIRDASVASFGNNESYTDGSIECGVNSSKGIQRIFLKYLNLPGISSSDVVVGAQCF